MRYLVEVVTGGGTTDQREFEAKTAREAEDLARRRGLFPIRVLEAGAELALGIDRQPTFFDRVFPIANQDRIQFTQKLSTFLKAGLPILTAMEILRDQTPGGPLRWRLTLIARDIAAGEPLANSLEKFPRDFSTFYVAAVRAGETGGPLPEILDRLGAYMDKVRQRKRKAVTAALYPCILLTAVIAVIAMVSLRYIPLVERFLNNLRVPLPPLTATVLDANKYLGDNILWMVASLVAFIVVYRFVLLRVRPMRLFLHTFWLKTPLSGSLIKRTNYSWMFRTFGMLSFSGVPVLNALRVTSAVIKNDVIRGEVDRIRDEVARGERISTTMEKGGLFDRFAVTMVDVGERSGELDVMMNRVADYYDEELDEFYLRLERVMPAVLTLAMAFLVGVVVVALYLPILTIIDTLANKKGF